MWAAPFIDFFAGLKVSFLDILRGRPVCGASLQIDKDMLTQVIERARKAQKLWAEVPIAKRAAWLKNFQKLILRKSDAIIAAIQADTKKPAAEALGIELATVLMTSDYYRKKAATILKTKKAKTHWMFKNKKVWVKRAPFGVVGILGPSNLPFSLTIGDAIPALMAGNSVVIKPSEWTPKSAEVGSALAIESGLPTDVLQVVPGGKEVGAEVVEKVDCIFFTGSTNVGRKVAARAGELLKPCILELGGKAPMIVFKDADLERAARACVWGRFAHSGQHCIAVERVYVAEKLKSRFLSRVVDLTQSLSREELSPLTLPHAWEHLDLLIQDALQKGAHLLCGGLKQKGPTILIDVDHSMRVMQEEAFGPLLPVMSFQSNEEALRLANESESGLSAVLFTKNRVEALEFAKKMESGNVSINDCMDHFMILDAPFGGWKNSGLGVRHSEEGLLQFTRPQTLFLQNFPLPFCSKKEFWWFPYRKSTEKLLKKLLWFFFG